MFRSAGTTGSVRCVFRSRDRGEGPVPALLKTAIGLTIDGVSFGMILFLMSSGMTVTLGVMRVVNLAHCGFAMIGGYFALCLVRWLDMGLLPALVIAVAGVMVLAALLEHSLYRWVYGISELGQVLMTIGLAFIMVATTNLLFGPLLHTLPVPAALAGTVELDGISISLYRSFLVVLSGAIALMLWLALEHTTFGARLRAAVDNARMARCAGIDVRKVFAVTFAVGCGLAAAGGVLGTQMLPLEPNYALKYLILVLVVVAVGGLGSLKGSFLAALMIGTLDTYGRYALPQAGGFVMYALIVLVLLVRPQGMVGRA